MAMAQSVLREAGVQTPASGEAPDRPRLVCIGGGTGLAATLRGVKSAMFAGDPVQGRERLTAIVTVADDGGSTGRLRRAYPVLAPGDIRNCLVALAEADPVLTSVFDFRFDG